MATQYQVKMLVMNCKPMFGRWIHSPKATRATATHCCTAIKERRPACENDFMEMTSFWREPMTPLRLQTSPKRLTSRRLISLFLLKSCPFMQMRRVVEKTKIFTTKWTRFTRWRWIWKNGADSNSREAFYSTEINRKYSTQAKIIFQHGRRWSHFNNFRQKR